MKSNLKLISDPVRAELATAIEEVARLEAESTNRRAILDRASHLVDQALDRLEKAKAEAAKAKEDMSARLVEAASSGAPIAPDNSSRAARIELADAEDELAAAISAMETIQNSVDPFDGSLSEAQARVRLLASSIMSREIDHLIHEADQLSEEHFEKRLALRAIMSHLDSNQQRDVHERINTYLSRPIFPLQLNHAAIENHSVTRNWRRANEELTSNANAELPRS